MTIAETALDTIHKWFSIDNIGPKENNELSFLAYACLSQAVNNANQLTDNQINVVKCSIFAAFQMGRRHPYTGPKWTVTEETPNTPEAKRFAAPGL